MKRKLTEIHKRRIGIANTKWKRLLVKSFLQKEDIKNHKPALQVANKIGCSDATILSYLKINKIKIRNRSECQRGKRVTLETRKKMSKLHKGKNNSFFGKHHTPSAKRKISKTHKGIKHKEDCKCSFCKDKSGKNNNMYGRITHSIGSYYKGIWIRSSYEIRFAYFLSLSGYKWKYESKTFDLGNTTYTPDFYIRDFNCYIEIKGWWRDDAKRKFNKFKRLYPKIRIKVLGQKELQSIGILD